MKDAPCTWLVFDGEGDAEHRAATEARHTGETSYHHLHQQDRPPHAGAQTAPHRRILQAQTHCG